MKSEPSHLGQIAFEAHCAHGGGHHIYGKTITDWNMLSPVIQEAWYQAALAVIEQVWKDRHSTKSVGISGNGFAQEVRASFDFSTNEFKANR